MNDTLLIGVYRIVSPNGSCYVGATAASFETRWNGHKSDFRLNKMKCSGLRRAFEKYGVDAMRWEILEVVQRESEQIVWEREKEWWIRLKSEGVNIYNGCPTGTGSVHHTKESRDKSSLAMSSKLKTLTCKTCSNTFKGFYSDFCSAPCKLASKIRVCCICSGGFSSSRRKPICYACRPMIVKNKTVKRQSVFCRKCKSIFETTRRAIYCSSVCYNLDRKLIKNEDKALRLYLEGYSLRQIGEKLGTSHVKVAKILSANDVKLRGKSGHNRI